MGADYTSQTLIDFGWYNPHLYQGTTVFTNLLPKIVFEANEVFVMLLVEIISNNKKIQSIFLPSALIKNSSAYYKNYKKNFNIYVFLNHINYILALSTDA